MVEKELRIEKLTNGFRNGSRETVLQENISAFLHPGDLVCLLGPNGAGKSTLMRTLSGFHQPLSGKISFSGKNLESMSLKARAREVAVVFTGQINDPFLTAFEVVSMGRFPYASFYGRLKKSDLEEVENTLNLLHVAHLKDKTFYQLSDGEKQKMLLARALVQDTPFLFLDEPVAFIDSPGKIEIMEWLSHFAHEQNKGILITTHDIELALDYADRLWLMNREKPLQKGIPEDLVLNGVINQYFDRERVVFDPRKGRFGSGNKPDRQVVYVKGDQVEMQWLCRAFTRMGKEVRKATAGKSVIYYSFDTDHFVLSRKDKEDVILSTIEEVMKREMDY
ncbi:MAG: ABC transporter ATP-binding protein [Bacteroidales bacterium]|nr:ABC transporter ATP-binding protein [Bacteroidales bacterium]